MLEILKETVRSFAAHGGRVLGAATAFYALLSVAPMVLMAVVVTGAVTDELEARRQIIADVGLWAGSDAASLLSEVLDNMADSGGGPLAGVTSVLVLLWASQRLFSQLRYSLNHLWGVREVSEGNLQARAARQARKRLSALIMVLVVILVLMATVIAKASLSAAVHYLGTPLPARWHVLELGTSFTLLTALFAFVFKVLPAVRLSWRDAWIGALATSLLFGVGAIGLGYYLGFKGTRSTYGAAGSIVAVLIWVYYSAQAFFLGAAFTRAHAERRGAGLELAPGAVRIVEVDGHPPPPESATSHWD